MRVLGLIGLLSLTGACMTLRPVAAPASYVTQQAPEIVWVNSADHGDQTIPLARPTVVGNQLQGHWLGTGEPVSLNLSRVTTMVARQPDKRRTALLVTGAAVIAGFIVWRATDDRGPQSGCVFDPRTGWNCP